MVLFAVAAGGCEDDPHVQNRMCKVFRDKLISIEGKVCNRRSLSSPPNRMSLRQAFDENVKICVRKNSFRIAADALMILILVISIGMCCFQIVVVRSFFPRLSIFLKTIFEDTTNKTESSFPSIFSN